MEMKLNALRLLEWHGILLGERKSYLFVQHLTLLKKGIRRRVSALIWSRAVKIASHSALILK